MSVPVTDEAQIRAVIERYFFAIDRGDRDALAACFTSDAHVEYTADKKIVLDGRAAVLALLDAPRQFSASTHLLANTGIVIAGDSARADTYATATLVQGARILVRGLQYKDDFVRMADGWRIARRIHTPLWQYETDAVTPGLVRR